MSDHDTHDYEHVWLPYGVQFAAPAPAVCVWTDNYDGVWTSACDEACDLLGESGPDHEGWRFCPFCGQPLQAVRP